MDDFTRLMVGILIGFAMITAAFWGAGALGNWDAESTQKRYFKCLDRTDVAICNKVFYKEQLK